jgi:hypothetical protein
MITCREGLTCREGRVVVQVKRPLGYEQVVYPHAINKKTIHGIYMIIDVPVGRAGGAHTFLHARLHAQIP